MADYYYKQKRAHRVRPEQTMRLVELMEVTPSLHWEGQVGGSGEVHQRVRRGWDDVAMELNNLGHAKTGQQWKTVWRDLKSRVRMKSVGAERIYPPVASGPSSPPAAERAGKDTVVPVWKDLRSKVRKKNAERKRGAVQSDNGSSTPALELSDMEKKVLTIMGHETSVGTGVPEMGLIMEPSVLLDMEPTPEPAPQPNSLDGDADSIPMWYFTPAGLSTEPPLVNAPPPTAPPPTAPTPEKRYRRPRSPVPGPWSQVPGKLPPSEQVTDLLTEEGKTLARIAAALERTAAAKERSAAARERALAAKERKAVAGDRSALAMERIAMAVELWAARQRNAPW